MPHEQRYLFFRDKIKKEKSIIKNCKICSGKGYIPTSEIKDDSFIEYKDCSCKKEFQKTKKFILANFPKKKYKIDKKGFKKIIIKNLITNEKIKLEKIAKSYISKFKDAKDKGLGLIFFGAPGTGKTTAALRILKSIINKYNEDCYYVYFKDLISLLMDTYSDYDKSPLFKEIISVNVLVIDELSLVGRVTNHMVAEFTSICKNRFENNQPTILISNYKTIEEIYDNFGEPMRSLINEAFASFEFLGKDIREEKFEYLKKFFE